MLQDNKYCKDSWEGKYLVFEDEIILITSLLPCYFLLSIAFPLKSRLAIYG